MTPARPPVFAPANAVLFLDFDGVLVDLAETPDSIAVGAQLPALLERLHRDTGGAVYLVSGRQVADLQRHLGGLKCTAYGCHGAEMAADGGAVTQLVKVEAAQIDEMTRELKHAAAASGAYLIEAKPSGAVLHYRRDPSLQADARALAERIVARYPGFHLHPAKMAFELRPDGVSKLEVVRAVLEQPIARGRTPVYLGDDTTDEPALEHVRALGGISIKVGSGESMAEFRLNSPAEVAAWLEGKGKE